MDITLLFKLGFNMQPWFFLNMVNMCQPDSTVSQFITLEWPLRCHTLVTLNTIDWWYLSLLFRFFPVLALIARQPYSVNEQSSLWMLLRVLERSYVMCFNYDLLALKLTLAWSRCALLCAHSESYKLPPISNSVKVYTFGVTSNEM